jgi:hypothetical protein
MPNKKLLHSCPPAWRVNARHHKVQETGREKVFSDYRIRIALVIHEARPGKPIWITRCETTENGRKLSLFQGSSLRVSVHRLKASHRLR